MQGRKGERIVPAQDLFVDMFTTAVGHGEVLTEIRLPYLPPTSASAYMKHSLRENDVAIVLAGTVLTVGDGNMCRDARIGLGAAGPIPLRATTAEQYLKDRILDEATLKEGAQRAVEGANPPSDMHGSKRYKLEVLKVLTNRSLSLSLSRIKSCGM
jgi:carbon-monoxide dehydrogenase medium subunit